MDAKQTGNIISKKRKDLGLTQIQLAEKLNVSNRAVSKWENGDGFPDITSLPAIAQALGITIDELLTGNAPAPVNNEQKDSSKILHQYKLIYTASIFFGLFSALLGGVTELYCIWAFPILFYTHWEIMFAAVSVFFFVLSVMAQVIGSIRLSSFMSKGEIINRERKRLVALAGIDVVFPLCFIARIIDFSRFGVLTPYVMTALIIALLVIGILFLKGGKNEKE